MMESNGIKQSAMAEIKAMLRDHLAKRLGGLKDGDSVSISVEKAGGKDDPLDEKKDELEAAHDDHPIIPDPAHPAPEDEVDDEDSPVDEVAEDEPADDDHPLAKLAMKKLNQLVKPKRG